MIIRLHGQVRLYFTEIRTASGKSPFLILVLWWCTQTVFDGMEIPVCIPKSVWSLAQVPRGNRSSGYSGPLTTASGFAL